ncbi:MAG: MFS transporter, partial [Candidatus Calescibacterium sp.]|nr:MFS transporter [Candidatus Calescibacterium sp.]
MYVLSGLIINICLGSIYSYSVLQIHLKKLFENEYGIKVSATEMQIPYLIFLALFSFCMPFAGKLIEKFGPQKIGIIGGILLSIAWFSASFAKSPLELSIIYGIIGGIAVGTVYNCPLVTVAKWFPDGRGLALGITLIGFGISPALISPIIDILTNNYGIKQTLKIMGLAFFIIIPLLASNLRTPSKIIKSENENGTEKNIKIKDMIRIPSFYGLWISFAIANFVGLMAIGISKPIGIEIATKSGISEKEITHILTFLMIPFAISNGLGRPLFGWLTDKLKPQKAATISLLSVLFAVIYIYFNSNSLFT